MRNLRLRLRFLHLRMYSLKTNVFQRCIRNARDDFPSFCSEIPMSSYEFQCPWSAKQQNLDFLKFFLKHSQIHEKRKEDRFLYDIVCSENVAWPSRERDSLIISLNLYRIRTQSTLQKRRCLAHHLNTFESWYHHFIRSLSSHLFELASLQNYSLFVAGYGRTTSWRLSRGASSSRPRVMQRTQGCCYCRLASSCAIAWWQ